MIINMKRSIMIKMIIHAKKNISMVKIASIIIVLAQRNKLKIKLNLRKNSISMEKIANMNMKKI